MSVDTYTAKNVNPNRELFTVSQSTDIKKAQKLLWEKKIYSCPVLDENGHVVNVIDLIDVVYSHLAAAKLGQDMVFQTFLSPEAREQAKSGKEFVDYTGIISLYDEEELRKIGKADLDQDEVGFVANLSQRNLWTTASPDTPISTLLKDLATYYRIVILKGEELVGYITRSDIIKFISKMELIQKSPQLKDKTITELSIGVPREKLVTIGQREKVAEGFKKLITSESSAVAVLDEDGNFVLDSFISLHNIKGVGEGSLIERLYVTVDEYTSHLKSMGTYSTPLVVSPTITFDNLVKTTISQRRHHAYILDDGELKGAISQGDIIRALIKYLDL